MAAKCVHHGCGKAFTDPNEPCTYHPGRPFFHDGTKGWTCCKTRAVTFDQFMQIPPCARGTHSTFNDTPTPKATYQDSQNKVPISKPHWPRAGLGHNIDPERSIHENLGKDSEPLPGFPMPYTLVAPGFDPKTKPQATFPNWQSPPKYRHKSQFSSNPPAKKKFIIEDVDGRGRIIIGGKESSYPEISDSRDWQTQLGRAAAKIARRRTMLDTLPRKAAFLRRTSKSLPDIRASSSNPGRDDSLTAFERGPDAKKHDVLKLYADEAKRVSERYVARIERKPKHSPPLQLAFDDAIFQDIPRRNADAGPKHSSRSLSMWNPLLLRGYDGQFPERKRSLSPDPNLRSGGDLPQSPSSPALGSHGLDTLNKRSGDEKLYDDDLSNDNANIHSPGMEASSNSAPGIDESDNIQAYEFRLADDWYSDTFSVSDFEVADSSDREASINAKGNNLSRNRSTNLEMQRDMGESFHVGSNDENIDTEGLSSVDEESQIPMEDGHATSIPIQRFQDPALATAQEGNDVQPDTLLSTVSGGNKISSHSRDIGLSEYGPISFVSMSPNSAMELKPLEKYLVEPVARELQIALRRRFGWISIPGDADRSIQSLLTSYAVLMDHSNAPRTHLERCGADFVRSSKAKIAESFRRLESVYRTQRFSQPAFDDANAAVSSWVKQVQLQTEEPTEMAPLNADGARDLDVFLSFLAYLPELQRILTQNENWDWLIVQTGRAFVGASLPYKHILSGIDTVGPISSEHRMNLRFFSLWHPKTFLEMSFSEQDIPILADVIVLVSSGRKPYATTCGHYVEQNWPTIGLPLLEAIDRLVRGSNEEVLSLSHGLDLEIQLSDMGVKFVAQAIPHVLADIGELIAWLGAACRASPFQDRNCSCMVYSCCVTTARARKHQVDFRQLDCYLYYECSELHSEHISTDGCWLNLFRQACVAYDFLVPFRWNNEPGLELSIPLMSLLGDAPWIDAHNGSLMVKGFSSLFLPVQEHEGSIVWHYFRAPRDYFIGYPDARMSCIKRSVVTTADVNWLREQRHFVGWTPKAQTYLGTEGYAYEQIQPPRVDFVKSGMVLEKATISGGYFMNIGIEARRGHHQAPVKGPDTNDYLLTLRRVSRYNVLLYDTDSKRAWLVDGASAVLHLCCTQLHSTDFIRELNLQYKASPCYASHTEDAYQILRDYRIRKQVLRSEHAMRGTTGGSMNTSGDVWCFEDLVALNCNYLLKMQEHQNIPPSGIDVRLTDRDRLEGWSFSDLVEQRDLMEPRIVYLQQSGRGWSEYTRRVRTITLMGRNFGELIKPTSYVDICRKWSTVPTGQDYLATTVRLLQANDKSYGGSGDFPAFLADGVRWHQASSPFSKCACPNQRCQPVQVICPKTSWLVKQPQIRLEDYIDGAILFGQHEKFRLWYPRDPTREPEKDTDGTKEKHEPKKNDDDAGIPISPDPSQDTSSSTASPNDADQSLLSSAPSGSSGSGTTPTTSLSLPGDTSSSGLSQELNASDGTPRTALQTSEGTDPRTAARRRYNRLTSRFRKKEK